uniref:Uncharacterized protein n=1 Tax=Oryza rufipogon TaxID=4529 RepID=A0A0E0QWC8_ORYRU
MASGGASSAPATASTPAAAAATTTTTSKTASASLWWDPFIDLSDDLDRAAAASPSVPDALAERIKAHHAWLRGSVSMFVKPSDASRGALDASEVVVGEHRLAVKPELKAAALRLSKCMNLDEVQSYILVKRTSENTPTALVADTEEFLRLVSVQYYLERQCLLKCIRRIFVHANDCSDSIDAVREEASVLVREEVEQRLLSIVRDSLASTFSVKGDMLSGSYDVGKFAVSVEAKNSFHYAKAQLLFILIQTLDFESLLRMVRDEVPFSGGYSTFSVVDILEMDVEVSKLPEFAAVESGPLILAWAVFLCLVMSLPGSNTNLDIDHTSYAQRSFEFAPFNYLQGVLCSSIFKESDGPVSGFRGILRTFISAFVASYEISYQTEDSSLGMILNILCEVYDGEESLCMQFWDKDSFIDGPIRFNYLERMNGVTTLYAVPRSDTDNVNYHDQIEIHSPISIFGIEGTTIPGGSHGYILKVLEDDVALVRWEFPHSGVLFLLVILAQDLHACNYEEACAIMDLLYKMVSSNRDLCLALLHADKSLAVQASQNLGYIDKHCSIPCVQCGVGLWLLHYTIWWCFKVLRKGAAADDIISSFIIFSVQYIMVNHMNWKYKSYSRWKITLKCSFAYFVHVNAITGRVGSKSAFRYYGFVVLVKTIAFRHSCNIIDIWRLQTSISCILDEVDKVNEVVAIFNLLSSAARYQEAILDLLSKSWVILDDPLSLWIGVLDLLKALWESGAQFIYILEKLRSSRTFWENLSCCIRAAFASYPIDSVETVDEKKSLRYCCLGTIFEIMSYELFLQGKLLTETKTSDPAPVGSKEQKEPSVAPCPSDIVLKWFDSTTMEDLVNHLSSNGYQNDLLHRAKLSSGDTGSLSFSLVKKIQLISSKLLQHRAFVALLSQYALHGYSGEQDITNLIISDLYYHIHGELEGRPITPGPFQELLCFLLEFKVFEHNPSEQLQKSFPAANGVSLFDVPHIRDELGLELWNHSDWKTYKEVAEKMLDIMHKANLMKCQVDAKLCALRSFITFLSVCTGTSSYKKFGLPGGGISITTTQSAVRCACKSLQSAVDSLPPEVDNSGVLFPPLSGQVELLLTITRILLDHAKQSKSSRHLYPVIVLLIKTSGASTSFLFNLMPSSPALKQPVKSLLVLLLSLFEFIYKKVDMKDGSEDVNIFGELSLLSMSLLPVLCKLAESREYFDLAIASMDIILKGFLPSNVWVPILQKHFRLQVILQKCQSGALLCTQVILNFLLTMGRTKDGAKILQSANIFAFIKVLLSQMSLDDSCLRNSLSTQTKDVKIWGLGLAIVSSLNHCMDDDISRNSVANSTISFLSGQVPLMSSYLSAQSVNTHQSKKRTLLQKSQTSLSALSLTENILTLLCILAKYHFPRDTGMKEVDSELREIIIHLLAFISRGSERTGDSPNWNLSFGCPPIIKEEMKLNEEPPLIRSKYGWFRFAASCTLSTPSVSGPPNAGLSLVIRDKNPADSDSMKQTRFTEMLAVQIYRIAFLIMKFLCSQAKEAVRRAEELEFLDLAHFPELPMPDILHGLQANVSTALNTETERVCQLLLVILETSLYMELCVSQSCGIRPVMGRFEYFSKGIKAMVHASEKHSSFKPLVRSLAQITTLLYPGIVQNNNLIYDNEICWLTIIDGMAAHISLSM